MFTTIKNYFVAVGLPTSSLLTQHATEHHHEDVPDEVAQEAEALSKTRTPSPITETIAPGRLRSLFPPANYGAILAGAVYRSSYPEAKNYDFLQSLKLKTIITLVPEEISPEYRDFMKSAGIQHFQVHINANKGGVRVQSCDMNRALNIALDRSNHPLLIHCNKGKHRTGCLTATLRRIQGFDIETIHDEYHTYSDPKARFWDEVFFENFELNTVMWLARREGWVMPNMEVPPPSPPPSPISLIATAKSKA